MTAASAEKMASERAKSEVVAALVPICILQAEQDPRSEQTMASLRDAASYKRRDVLIDTGWATMPGQDAPDRAVASACLDRLLAQF